MMRWAAASCVLFVAISADPVCATGAEAPSPAALLEAARRAVAAEDYEQAIERYAHLRRLMPEAPELPYNMGVAAYRDGDLDRAAEFFREALALAEDLPLRSKSAYNLGTTAYARNLQPAASPGAEGPGAQLDGAIEELRKALGHYRQAIDADPLNADAKANAELTHRRLKRLEELREQMQQMQQDQQQNQQEQQDQPQQQQENQQASQDQPQEPGDQSQQNQQEESGEPQAPPQDQQRQEQQEQQTGQAAEAQQGQAEDAAQRRTMTRQEAERLLQSVRDKERRRREELADRQEGRRPPVDKDW